MERLTEWINDNEPFAIMRQNDLKIGHKTCIDKLAAYEDTGLEPEEVKHFTNVCQEAGETYNCHFNYVVKCVLEHKKLKKLLKKATSIEGFIDYHYDEIEEALKDEV